MKINVHALELILNEWQTSEHFRKKLKNDVNFDFEELPKSSRLVKYFNYDIKTLIQVSSFCNHI